MLIVSGTLISFCIVPVSGTRRALEKTSLNSHHHDQARVTAISDTYPPDPHSLLSFVSLGEGDTRCLGPRYPLYLNCGGEWLHCLRRLYFPSFPTSRGRGYLGPNHVYPLHPVPDLPDKS
eukprot:1147061-Pelagomonas_calceolata.AAC.2